MTHVMNASNKAIPFSFMVIVNEDLPPLQKALSATITLIAFVQVTANTFTAIAISLDKKIRNRKEFIYMIYISVGDALEGLFLFPAFLSSIGKQEKWRCLVDLRHIAFVYGGQFSKATMVTVSIDRILAIGFPVWYWTKTGSLAHLLSSGAVVYALVAGSVAYVVEWLSDIHMPINHCWTKATFKSTLQWINLSRGILSFASVAGYAVVLVLYSRFTRAKKSRAEAEAGSPSGSRAKEEEKERKKDARQVTVTLGMTVGLAFCLTVVPLGVIRSFLKRKPAATLTHFTYPALSLTSCYSIANIGLFMLRHPQVTVAFRNVKLNLLALRGNSVVSMR